MTTATPTEGQHAPQKGVLDVIDDLIYGGFKRGHRLDARVAEQMRSRIAELIKAADAIADKDHTYVDGYSRDVTSAHIVTLRKAAAACRAGESV